LTFGGFVGLASYLSIFFYDQYHLSKVHAGDFTTVVVLFGSFLRPVGGVLADKFGGYRMLLAVLTGAGLCLGAVATLPSATVALAFLAVGMGLLGMGNGSVFQIVPQRFPASVGIMTGIIGAAGGFGGFLLPSILGSVKDKTGSFGVGFAVLTTLMFAGVIALVSLRPYWRRSWSPDAAVRAGVIRETEVAEVYASSASL
jgi:NNP family nitrate/nitrite transporter-like MFS transporter